MKYVRLGRTGLHVSQLGLGTMPFGGRTDEDEAGRIVQRCLDAGVNHFDCANVYEAGRAEEILGRVIAPYRDDVVIATKFGFASGPGRNDQGASPGHMRTSVEASLRRLATDRIDVLYLHRFDHRASIEHTFRTFDSLVRSGKVLHVGVSNFAAWQVVDALAACERNRWAPIDVLQPMYNLVKRQAEVELLPMCSEKGIAVLPYSPLAGGLLTGKYVGGPGSADGRLTDSEMYRRRYRDERSFEVARELTAIADEVGVHPATLAVAWVARRPGVTAPLIGGTSVEQLEPSLAAADLELDDEVMSRITALSPTPPPPTDRTEELPDD